MNSIKERWGKTPKPLKIICYVILGILGAIAFGFIFGYLIELLWNWLMPDLFNLKKISYWQGIGIFLLARILFGSFGTNSDNSKQRKDKKVQKSLHDEDDEESTRNYDEWWEKEGKKAFDDFVEKKYSSLKRE